MSIWLREDTAVTIVLGPFVDPTTPETEEEALTINQAAVRLSKNGGAFAQKNDATAATHMENGFYSCPLNATDTSTPGSLVVAVDDANALIWWKEYHVIPQQVWDSLFSTDRLQVHAAEISNDLITAAAIASDAITAAKVANGTIDAATFAAGAITATVIATGAIDADALATDAITEIQAGLSTFDHTTDTVNLSSATETQIDDILVDTAAINALTATALPNSEPGTTGGLSTFDDVNAGVVFGSVDDTTPAAGNFDGNSALSTTDDFYNGRWLIFTSNALGARKVTDYVGATRTFSFSGSAGEADQAFPGNPANGDTFLLFGFHGD